MNSFFIGWCLGGFITLNTKILLSHNKRKAFLIKNSFNIFICGEIQQLIPYAETRRMLKIFLGRRTESDRTADGIRLGGGRERWKDVGDYETESEK